MIFKNINTLPNKKNKIVIIGSGPAGLSLALELEKRKIETLILEAGSLSYDEESQKFYEAEVIGDHLVDNISSSRLRMFGGTSGHWGGTCRTLDSYDLEKWPFKKNILDSYTSRAAKILKIKPNFREKYINKDFKIVEFQNSRIRFGFNYRDHIKNSKIISVVLNSPVTRFVGKSGLCKSVEVNFEGNLKQIHGKLFILATGGIENSRILLWTREKNKSLIDSNLPIGKTWYTHPFNILGKGFLDNKKIKSLFNHNLNEFENAFGWGLDTKTFNLSPTNEFIKKKNILNSCIFLIIHDRKNDSIKNIIKNLLCVSPRFSENFVKQFEKKLFCGVTFASAWEQNPNENNKIILTNDFDTLGMPKVKIIYKKDEIVRKTARIMMEELGVFFIKKNIGRVAIENFLYESIDYKTDGGGQHHLGGTIMGDNIKKSVVNSDLKIHSTKNIYVLGSSVYPSGGHANPTFTIVQLAVRLSDLINKIV